MNISESAGSPKLLSCEQIDRSFGGLKALNGVSLSVSQGEIFGLVGPNGSGKTTMVNAITGFYAPDAGKVIFNHQDITGIKPYLNVPSKQDIVKDTHTFKQCQVLESPRNS